MRKSFDSFLLSRAPTSGSRDNTPTSPGWTEPVQPRSAGLCDFRAHFEQDAPFVRRILRSRGIPRADIEDLLQDIFVVIHRRLPEYDYRSPFRSWIYGICLRTISTYRRSAMRRRLRAQRLDPTEEYEGLVCRNPEREIDLRRACLRLEALLFRLDEDKRRVFVLFEIEGLSMTEVAEAVGCPLQTAYSRLHAARKAMRSNLRAALRG
jgi:RNA polymerase sigma-70 factor, ECF subfamily